MSASLPPPKKERAVAWSEAEKRSHRHGVNQADSCEFGRCIRAYNALFHQRNLTVNGHLILTLLANRIDPPGCRSMSRRIDHEVVSFQMRLVEAVPA